MTAAELIALAERVEGLTGACDNTDCEIAFALDLECHENDDGVWGSDEPFTDSLDAALGLVPSGCDWSAYSSGRALIWRTRHKVDVAIEGRAPTPALALTAAALRARAAEIADGKGK